MDDVNATRIGARTLEHRALGRAIREARVRRGLSQESAGFRADIHRNQWGALERGEANPTFKSLLQVSTGLQLPLSEIMGLYERQVADTMVMWTGR